MKVAASFLVLALSGLPVAAQEVMIDTARGAESVSTNPETVVAFDLAAVDTLGALGIPVAGRPDMLGTEYLEASAGNAPVVGTVFEPEFEAVNALAPDLVIVGGRSSTQYDALSRIAPMLDMTIPGETLVETGLDRIDAYGMLFAKEDEATALRGRIEDKIERARVAIDGNGNGLIVLTNGPKVSAYGSGTRFGWVHDTLGLPEAVETESEGRHGQPVSFEFIAEADPDWLLVIDRAAAIGDEGARAAATLDNPLVAETTAWREGQVVYLDPADAYLVGGGAQAMERTLDTLIDAFGTAASDS